MYRFLLRPRWILLHLVAVALVVLMVNLGFWQLSRLDEKRDRNALLEARAALEVQPVADVLDVGDGDEVVDEVEWRRLTATGEYAVDDEVLVRGRSMDGAPGVWVLTPLVADDGTAVVVNRGWVPASGVLEETPPEAAATTGRVTVQGLLVAAEERGALGAVDPEGVELATLARVDLDRYAQQLDYDIYPAYLRLEAQQPPVATTTPVPLPEPDRTEGPHLGYAGQWFAFSIIGVVGYVLLMRRSAHQRATDAAAAEIDGDTADDAGTEPTPVP
ncbi:MAG: SURF1 family protein [Actinomycetota bacterium]|nr:SURF1 family protein [Actinomycetota bacterium]